MQKDTTSIQNKNLTGRFVDPLGRVVMTEKGLEDLLIEGIDITDLLVVECDETVKFNRFRHNSLQLYTDEMQNQTQQEFDAEMTSIWTSTQIVEDLEEWLYSKCSTTIQKDRVLKELNMYRERNLYPLLHHLIFLVDHFRHNNIVWGVGRGSSVASYVLYLIGVHKVDSILYNLEIDEFLR